MSDGFTPRGALCCYNSFFLSLRTSKKLSEISTYGIYKKKHNKTVPFIKLKEALMNPFHPEAPTPQPSIFHRTLRSTGGGLANIVCKQGLFKGVGVTLFRFIKYLCGSYSKLENIDTCFIEAKLEKLQ